MRVSGDAFSVPTTHRVDDRAVRTRCTQRQMSRINASLIHHPRVSIVNSLHATPEQTTRADQKRRHDIAEDRRTKHTHQRKREWPVVVNRSNQDELLNSIWIIESACRSDSATVRRADNNRARDPERIEQAR